MAVAKARLSGNAYEEEINNLVQQSDDLSKEEKETYKKQTQQLNNLRKILDINNNSYLEQFNQNLMDYNSIKFLNFSGPEEEHFASVIFHQKLKNCGQY